MGGALGGSGGGIDIPQRNLTGELNNIFGAFKSTDLPAFHNWFSNEPLLSGSRDIAQQGFSDLPGLQGYLKDLLKTAPGQFSDLYNKTGALAPGIKSTFDTLYNQTGKLAPQLQGMLGSLGDVYSSQVNPILQSGGALTPEQGRDVSQQTRNIFAAQGNVHGNQAAGAELLNRDQFRQNRFNTALGQGLGISGEERGLTQGLQGIYGQQAGLRGTEDQLLQGIYGQQAGLRGTQDQLLQGLYGQQANLLGQQTGVTQALTSGIQGLESGAINPALQTEQTATGTYATLLNPLLNYGSDLFSSNQNAAAAQSIAGGNKTSGTIGGITSILGSLAAAY